jgi:hypothetical protein
MMAPRDGPHQGHGASNMVLALDDGENGIFQPIVMARYG